MKNLRCILTAVVVLTSMAARGAGLDTIPDVPDTTKCSLGNESLFFATNAALELDLPKPRSTTEATDVLAAHVLKKCKDGQTVEFIDSLGYRDTPYNAKRLLKKFCVESSIHSENFKKGTKHWCEITKLESIRQLLAEQGKGAEASAKSHDPDH